MTNKDDKRELTKESNDLKSGISNLQNQLNELDKKKEEFFSKKDLLKKEILNKIKLLKENFKLEDISSVNMKKEKEKRDSCRSKVRELISKLREISRKKKNLCEKYKIRSISSIDSQIEKLEMDIETKALSFKNEHKLMDKIKLLKKIKKEFSSLGNGEINKEIDEYNKKADEYHEKVKQFLEGKKKYKEFIVSSREINEMKKNEKGAYKSFLELKKEFGKINNRLKKNLLKLMEINGKLKSASEIKKRKIKQEQSRIIGKKSRDVEEKIRKGRKLTEEDLIDFQGR